LHSKPFKSNRPKYKWYIVSNYQETKTVAIIKIHHVIADGMGILTIVGNLCDDYSQISFPIMPSIPVFKLIFAYIIGIFLIPYYLFKELL